MSVMYVATLDILTEKGGFDPQAARAIGEAIDLEIARARDASATREDLGECRRELSEEIGTLAIETDKSISELRLELGAFRTELKEAISALRTELKEDISALRTELKSDISALRAELKGDISELKVEMQSIKAGLVRWVFVVMMGQTATLLGVLYFFIKYIK
ncbi:MAG TPA: hypothetical protein VMU52_10385 [Steroidobacteraceae bacterium]|nr:hypothetical protein [Steroidobacteraceae bacterium]